MATYTEKLESENLKLKQSLQDSINWVFTNFCEQEFVEFDTFTPHEILHKMETALSRCVEIVPNNQVDLFEGTENKLYLNEFEVKETLFNLNKRFFSMAGCVPSISKDSLILVLEKASIITNELIQDLKNKTLKR